MEVREGREGRFAKLGVKGAIAVGLSSLELEMILDMKMVNVVVGGCFLRRECGYEEDCGEESYGEDEEVDSFG